MKTFTAFLLVVVALSFVRSPKAEGNGPKFDMTEAAFNVKAWQSYQKTAVVRASFSPTRTPTRTPTPKPTATPI